MHAVIHVRQRRGQRQHGCTVDVDADGTDNEKTRTYAVLPTRGFAVRLKNVCSVAPKKPAAKFTREATVLTVVLNCTNRDVTRDADAATHNLGTKP